MGATGARCPACHGARVRVVMTADAADGIVRRRSCQSCGHRWYTIQGHELILPPEALRWQHDVPVVIGRPFPGKSPTG